MVYSITVDDTLTAGLDYMRDQYNQNQGTNLSTSEFLAITLSSWSRHGTARQQQAIGKVLLNKFNASTPAVQQQMLT